MRFFTFIDLFAGIGGFHLALKNIGGECVFASEIDKFAGKTYKANHGICPAGDIREESVKRGIPTLYDILCAGFPCQAFSQAGERLGFEDTRGTLFFEIAEVIRRTRPAAVILENVKGLRTHDKGKTLQTILSVLRDDLGYFVPQPEIINSIHFGVPQFRERLFIVGFRCREAMSRFTFPIAQDYNQPHDVAPPYEIVFLKHILEPHVPAKYTLSDKTWTFLQAHAAKHKARGNGFGYCLHTEENVSRTLTARYGNDGSEILIKQEGQNPRKLTPRECARLMGFPDSFKIVVSDSQAYKQFGNSVVVPAVQAVAEQVLKALGGLS